MFALKRKAPEPDPGAQRATLPVAPPQRGDEAYLSAVRAAQVAEASPHVVWTLYLVAALIVSALVWATLSRVDEVTKADARVVPDGHEQIIASLEGGILRELLVHEGEQVEAGQDLAMLDPTRFEAQRAEGESRLLALQASIARLNAEAVGRAPEFPPEVLAHPQIAQSEEEVYLARKRALDESVSANARGVVLLRRELSVSESMSAKGLLSEVEVLHLRRQIIDLEMQTQDRVNRFRQDATTELVRQQTEFTGLQDQQVNRRDMLQRTVIRSPVRGLVKAIRINTVGGVVGAGAPIMEIVPIGPRLLIEARVRPAEIGFLRVGQLVKIKLAAYDFTIYGGLDGVIDSISPDAIGDTDRGVGLPDNTYYRIMVRVDHNTLHEKGKILPVLPGMTGTAEVRIGERSVLNFLLRPMLKSKEAFRER